MNSLANDRGIGMIEAMVAVGILAIGMFAFMSQMSSQVGSQKNIHANAEIQSTVEEIQQAFAVNNICKANLQGLTFDKTLVAANGIYPELGIAQIVLPSAPTDPLVVSGSALKTLPGSQVVVDLVNVREYTADVLYAGAIRFRLAKDARTPASVTGPNNVTRTIPITLKVTASGSTETIVDCYTGSQSSSSSSIDGGDVGAWVGSGVTGDPDFPDCSSGLAYAVRNSGTALSVSGNCMPIGAKCKIPGATSTIFFVETCTGKYTDFSGPGGGGAGEGDSAGGASGNGGGAGGAGGSF